MSREQSTTHVKLIGYGSLMSGLGLAQLGRLRVRHAARVELRNARRGFAKHAQRGNRFAMVLEAVDPAAPIEARILGVSEDAGSNPEALLLEVSATELRRISTREGYDANALKRLQSVAAVQQQPLAEFLWTLWSGCGFDIRRYRDRLFVCADYTSPHYVPHPVPLGEAGYAITFLAPGAEGSGSPGVVPVRVRTGNPPLMTASEAWAERPNATQIAYFTSCFLGALHGICQRDLIADLDEGGELYRDLRLALVNERPAEQQRFLTATGIKADAYRGFFGDAALLARSGLSRLFDDNGA